MLNAKKSLKEHLKSTSRNGVKGKSMNLNKTQKCRALKLKTHRRIVTKAASVNLLQKSSDGDCILTKFDYLLIEVFFYYFVIDLFILQYSTIIPMA